MCPRDRSNLTANILDNLRLLLVLDEAQFDFERIPPANLKTRDDEILNSQGGYVFKVNTLNRIRRFLIMGTSGGTYYISEKALTTKNLEDLIQIIKDGKGGLILREILDISLAGRAPRQEPTMFALALLARYDVKDRVSKLSSGKESQKLSEVEKSFNDYIVQLQKAAFKAVAKVCRIPTHLFMFVKFCEIISKEFGSTGWSRMMRKAISSWYLEKDPKLLAMHITKYQQREGWSHRDLLRLCHADVAKKNEQALLYDQIFHYAVNGNIDEEKNKLLQEPTDMETDQEEPTKKRSKRNYELKDELVKNFNNSDALKFLRAVIEMKKLNDSKDEQQVQECASLIRKYGLVREHVDSSLLNSPKVWIALLEKMPMTALIRNLSKLSALELITDKPENEEHVNKVIAALTNEKSIKSARVHPLAVLLASTTYKGGRGYRGSLSWQVNDKIVEALEKAFLLAFHNVEPTNKKICLALDVSGSMYSPIMNTHLSCREASVAFSMCFLKSEPNVTCMAFQSEFVPLPFDKTWEMQNIIKYVDSMDTGGCWTYCELPMIWATKEKKEFDAFIVFTDNETSHGKVKPYEAMKEYREKLNLPNSKLIVAGMTATEFTIADPLDPGMLDVVGFDSAVPELVHNFILGKI
uniref:TROVE domain-containing protein n=1 Tax=Acrobeloides nanus TaxID=290746 RepID=A0A914CSU9_9BILA